MLYQLSWKNIWRNKLRSFIVIIALTLGVFAAVFMTAFMNGMVEYRVKSIIQSEISHIQIHEPDFQENYDFSLIMKDADNILKKTSAIPHVIAASKRIVISTLISTSETNSGVKIIGIVPDTEKKVSNIYSKISTGTYFKGNKKDEIVIGQKLAQKLRVKINDEITITVRDVNKEIINEKFYIIGIYETDNAMFDEATVFVRYNDLCNITGLKGTEAHEIAVLLDMNENSTDVKLELKNQFPTLEIQDWMEISPDAGALVSMMDQYMGIFILIILAALCFGIINTMLMVVLERVKEIGMLMAIGMSKAKIFFMIMIETVYLSFIGGLFGIVISYILCKHLEKTGLNLYFWKDAFTSVGFSAEIYPVINSQMILFTTLMVVFTGVISALYPAYKALKFKPAEAIRTE